MSTYSPEYEEPEEIADEYGFLNDDTAMQHYYEGFFSSSDPDSDWYTGEDVSYEDRYEAREAFIDWIDTYYPDFDWAGFWEDWRDMYDNN